MSEIAKYRHIVVQIHRSRMGIGSDLLGEVLEAEVSQVEVRLRKLQPELRHRAQALLRSALSLDSQSFLS